MTEQIDPKALSEELVAQFPIRKIAGLKPLNIGLGLRLNDFGGTLFLVETEIGDYVAKIFAPSQPDPQCMLEPRLMSWLAQHDFESVAPVLRTKSGAEIGKFMGRSVFLLKHVACTRLYKWNEPSWTIAECAIAGNLLAKLHGKLALLSQDLLESWNLAAKLQPATLGSSGDVGVSSIRPYLKKWLSHAFLLLESANQLTMPQPIAQLALSKQPMIMTTLDSAERDIEKNSSPNNEILVHGDYHAGNLLWQNNRIDAVIDFENAHYEHRAYDLAYSLVMFSSDWQNKTPGTPFDGKLAKSLSDGYFNGAGEITPDVVRTLSPYMQLTACLIVLWLLHDSMRSTRFHIPLAFLLKNLELIPDFSTAIAREFG